MLTICWSDGSSCLPMDFALLSSADAQKRLCGSQKALDKRCCAYQRRKEATEKATAHLETMVKRILSAGVSAGYLLMDNWFPMSNWPKLIIYLEDGRLRPDNNVAENAIQPFVLDRKNWLFAGHPDGAAAGAVFFSLIGTSKANGLEPFTYLRHVFEKLPLIKNPDEYRLLLPWAVDRAILNCPRP